MLNIEAVLKEKIAEIPDYSITTLFADADAYFVVIKNVIHHLVMERNMGGVYLTATRPAKAILSRLRADKIKMADVYFIDCISYTVGGGGVATSQIVYLESPSMLEGILLKMEWLLRRIRTEKKFMFFDSINTLQIYNEEKILLEFLHVLVNKLRTEDVFSVILSMGSQTNKSIESMLSLACDDTIDIRRSVLMAAKKEAVYSLGEGT